MDVFVHFGICWLNVSCFKECQLTVNKLYYHTFMMSLILAGSSVLSS